MRTRTKMFFIVAITTLLCGAAALQAAGPARRRAVMRLDEIEGIVARISGDTLVIRTQRRGDREVRITSSTEVIIDGRSAGLSLVQVGDEVEAKVRQDGSTYTAVRIEVKGEEAHLELGGTVKAVSETLLTLTTSRRDVDIVLTPHTFVLIDGHRAQFSALTVGARVKVEVLRRSDGTYEALIVELNSETIEFEGVITAVSESSLTIRDGQGRAVTVGLSATTVVRVDDRILPASALMPGMAVEIHAVRNADGTLTALRVEADEEDDLLEIEGVVTAIGSASIDIRTRSGDEITITISPDVIVRLHGRVVSLSVLKVGDAVEVHARRNGDTLTAVRIQIEEDEDEDELVEVKGVITTISGSMLTLKTRNGEVVVVITSATVIRRDDHTVPASELEVGQRVEAKGERNSDGSLQATEIEIDEDADDDDVEVELKGKITTVTTSEVTVQLERGTSATAAITPSTTFEKDDRPATAADLMVGQRVEIKARRNSDGTYVAIRIEIEDEDDDD